MHSIKSLIREAKEINSLINAFAKKNPNINPKDLERLFTADPTTVQNSRGVFAGKYCVWIGNQYVNGKLKVGDIPELKKALNTYNINKSQITTPINEIGSLSDLITIISDYTDDFKATRQLSKGEQALEKVYEDGEWVVYIPHTYKASRKIGGDTNWCTASSDDYYFNSYNYEGPLYVNIRKSDGAKFQFHFPSRQFMDINDEEVSIRGLGLSEGLVKFYETVYPKFNLYMKYDWISEDNNYMGYFLVTLNNKSNLINDNGLLIFPTQWFDNIEPISNFDLVIVKLKGKNNIVNNKGMYILKEWVDEILFFQNLFENFSVRVCINNKWNVVNSKGEYGFKEWFDRMDLFFEAFFQQRIIYYKVKLNNKYNIIGPTFGKFLIDVWLDEIEDFEGDFAGITLNGKENFLIRYFKDNKPYIKIFSDIWFDRMDEFQGKYALVQLKEKWNLINGKGDLVFKEWFDAIYRYGDDYVVGKLNGEDEFRYIPYNNGINENKIQVTKSDIKNMVMECVCRIISEKIKKI